MPCDLHQVADVNSVTYPWAHDRLHAEVSGPRSACKVRFLTSRPPERVRPTTASGSATLMSVISFPSLYPPAVPVLLRQQRVDRRPRARKRRAVLPARQKLGPKL